MKSDTNSDNNNGVNAGDTILEPADDLSDFATAEIPTSAYKPAAYEPVASIEDGFDASDAALSMSNDADRAYIYGGRRRRSSSIL